MSQTVGEDFRSSEPTASRTSKNGSNGEPTASGSGSMSLVRKPTGPRTPQDKERSKHNATTHGIFSKAVVVRGESPAEFNALLRDLHNDLQPVGMLEELLVEKLASLFWRSRRLLIAEGAEICPSSEFVAWGEKESQRQEAARLPQLSCNGGLIRQIANPEALQGCLDLLTELKENVEDNGFHSVYDRVILVKLYGAYDKEENWQKTLFNSYLLWFNTSLATEEERLQEGFASPEESKGNFLRELNEEIKRLGKYKKEQATILSGKSKLELLRQNVPDAPQLDRLLRYETSLERGIERTLNQLERLQRMRLGQPVPPPINLNVTASKG